MIVTEQEARQKWCPHVRASLGDEDNNASNRAADGDLEMPRYAMCIGSRCMMWHWKTPPSRWSRRYVYCDDRLATAEPPRPEGLPESWVFFPFDEDDEQQASWLEPEDETMRRQRGFCGLAYTGPQP